MQHWHRVLPGKVLDVHYEETVGDLEAQVRRILAHCGLPFEEACLRFHETERAVRTASSEQVRQPLYTRALGTWRRYEKHLGPWQEELADIIAELPDSVRNAGPLVEGPDLEAVDGVADVHGQVDREHALVLGAGRRRETWTATSRRTTRVRQHGEPARETLARDAALIELAVQELVVGIARHADRAIFAAVAAPGIAQHARLGVVEQHAVTERPRIVRARRQLDRHPDLPAVEDQHSAGLETRQVHAALRAVHVVEMQLVEHQRAVVLARIEGAPRNRNCSVSTCIAQANSFWSRSKPRMLSKPVEARNSVRSQTAISWQCLR